MKQHAIIPKAVLAGTAVFLSTGSGLLAGEPAPYVAPVVPPPDCSGCIDPGFFLEGSLLYMNSYAGGSSGYDGDWDFGYRGAVGFETASGLFAQLTGFYYEGDFEEDDGFDVFDGEVEAFTIDLLIGDTVHCGELCVAIAGGVRYGGVEFDRSTSGTSTEPFDDSYEFDGWGPMIEIAAERALSENFALYMELRQSILFGEADYDDSGGFSSSSDTLASITEIAAGIQFSFGVGPVQNAFLRLGVEGQYWAVDGSDLGLLGGVLSVGGTF